MKRLILLGSALLGAAPLAAQQTPVDSTQVHMVRPGDTLWDLARQYLGDPYRWPEIFRLNQDAVQNPHRIFPSERLRIPLAVMERLAAQAETRTDRAPAPSAGETAAAQRTVFFREEPETASREHLLRLADEAEVAVVSRGEFMRAGQLLREGEIAPLGTVAELMAPSTVPLERQPQIGQFDQVYLALSQPGAVRVGDRLQLIREGRRIRPHGRVYETTGTASVVAVDGNVATLLIEELLDAVAVGNWAVPVPDYSVPAGVRPREVSGGVEGTLLAFEEPHPLQTIQDVAFLDVGANSGVAVGDEFVVTLPTERKRWGVRPEIVVARLRVVRVAATTAAAQVVEQEHPALEPGLRVRLVAKMP